MVEEFSSTAKNTAVVPTDKDLSYRQRRVEELARTQVHPDWLKMPNFLTSLSEAMVKTENHIKGEQCFPSSLVSLLECYKASPNATLIVVAHRPSKSSIGLPFDMLKGQDTFNTPVHNILRNLTNSEIAYTGLTSRSKTFLGHWKHSGVFMMYMEPVNCPEQPVGHIWEKFTGVVLDYLNKLPHCPVWWLAGTKPQRLLPHINPLHKVFVSVSPTYSAKFQRNFSFKRIQDALPTNRKIIF